MHYRVTSPRWATALAVIATTLCNFPIWVFSGLAPSISEELDFGAVRLGIGTAAFFAMGGLCAIPAGTVVERIGWRRGLFAASVLISVSLIGMASAPNYMAMVGFLVLGAVGFAFTHPSTGQSLAQTVPKNRQASAFGFKQAALPLSTLLIGVTTPLFLGRNGWRWAFAWSAVLTIMFLIMLAAEVRRAGPQVAGMSRLRFGRRRGDAAAGHRPQPPLLIMSVGAGLGSMSTASIGGFIVVFAVASGMSHSQSGLLLALGSIVCLLSRLITGWVADRRGRGHLRVVAIMMLAGAAGFVLLALSSDRHSLLAIGAGLAMGLGWAWNGLFAFAVVHNHPQYPAAATGVAQSVMGAGSASGPAAFGIVVSTWSYSEAWLGTACTLALGAGFILFGRRVLARAVKGGGVA